MLDNWCTRFLAVSGSDDPGALAAKVQAFRVVVLMVVAAESLPVTVFMVRNGRRLGPLFLVCAIVFFCCLLLALREPTSRLATGACLLAMTATFAFASFPDVGNHQWLHWLSLALLTFMNLGLPAQQQLALAAVRWMAVIVFFYTGLQKVLYGLYFKGQFLAYVIGTEDRFSSFFGLLLPQSEVDRLKSLGGPVVGAGPYQFEHWPAIVLSNATVLAEMLVPLLLLWRRTRLVGVFAALVLLVNIELGARELMFGVTFANMLLLFFHKAVNRWFVLPFALFLAVLMLAKFFVSPSWYFA